MARKCSSLSKNWLLTIVVLLTIAAAFFEGRRGQFELLVSRPSLQIFEFLELKYNHY